jgi:cobalamin biosynthesis protein CbiG
VSDDPSVQVVQDAIAFATAAVAGHAGAAHELADDALELDAPGFVDALVSVVRCLAEELDEAGGDPGALLCDLGLGIQLAALAEQDHRGERP